MLQLIIVIIVIIIIIIIVVVLLTGTAQWLCPCYTTVITHCTFQLIEMNERMNE